jgi:hypothetical protein
LSTASLAADGITFASSENLSLILDLVLDKEAAAAETLLSFTSNYPDDKPYKVKRILKHKVVSQGKEKVYMYKVRWASYEKKYYEWISPDQFDGLEMVEEYHQVYPRRVRRMQSEATS